MHGTAFFFPCLLLLLLFSSPVIFLLKGFKDSVLCVPVLSIVTNTWGNTTTSPFFPIVKSVFVYVAIAWGQKHNMISVCSYACIHQIMLDLTTHHYQCYKYFCGFPSVREFPSCAQFHDPLDLALLFYMLIKGLFLRILIIYV